MSTDLRPQGLGDDTDARDFWGHTLLAADGAFLLGLSIIVTILGTQLYYRLRGQPVNNSVAGLVMGMSCGAIVFSDLTYDLFGNLPHRVIKLDSQVCFLCCEACSVCLVAVDSLELPANLMVTRPGCCA